MASVALDSCLNEIQVRPIEAFEFLALDEDEEVAIYKVVNHWEGIELKKQGVGVNHGKQRISAHCWTPTVRISPTGALSRIKVCYFRVLLLLHRKERCFCAPRMGQTRYLSLDKCRVGS